MGGMRGVDTRAITIPSCTKNVVLTDTLCGYLADELLLMSRVDPVQSGTTVLLDNAFGGVLLACSWSLVCWMPLWTDCFLLDVAQGSLASLAHRGLSSDQAYLYSHSMYRYASRASNIKYLAR
jgi:hypothetical protein